MPTRERLASEGLRLFAERGFDSVSVGDIEQAVGLAPRRGAMYRHFASKADLLTAVVEEHLRAVVAARARFASATSDDGLGADQAEELGAWILGEMDRQRAITHVLERDGARLGELCDRFREEVSDAGYAGLADILSGWLATRTDRDVEALAVLLLGALVNVRRSTWTLGDRPLGTSDQRLVTEWARLVRDVLHAESGSA